MCALDTLEMIAQRVWDCKESLGFSHWQCQLYDKCLDDAFIDSIWNDYIMIISGSFFNYKFLMNMVQFNSQLKINLKMNLVILKVFTDSKI